MSDIMGLEDWAIQMLWEQVVAASGHGTRLTEAKGGLKGLAHRTRSNIVEINRLMRQSAPRPDQQTAILMGVQGYIEEELNRLNRKGRQHQDPNYAVLQNMHQVYVMNLGARRHGGRTTVSVPRWHQFKSDLWGGVTGGIDWKQEVEGFRDEIKGLEDARQTTYANAGEAAKAQVANSVESSLPSLKSGLKGLTEWLKGNLSALAHDPIETIKSAIDTVLDSLGIGQLSRALRLKNESTKEKRRYSTLRANIDYVNEPELAAVRDYAARKIKRSWCTCIFRLVAFAVEGISRIITILSAGAAAVVTEVINLVAKGVRLLEKGYRSVKGLWKFVTGRKGRARTFNSLQLVDLASLQGGEENDSTAKAACNLIIDLYQAEKDEVIRNGAAKMFNTVRDKFGMEPGQNYAQFQALFETNWTVFRNSIQHDTSFRGWLQDDLFNVFASQPSIG